MSKVRVVRERIDPRLTAALFANYRTPIDAILELVDNAVDSRRVGQPISVDIALRPGAISLTVTGGRGMGPRELEREYLRWGVSRKRPGESIGRYGQGGKAAIGHLGERFSVVASRAGDERAYAFSDDAYRDRRRLRTYELTERPKPVEHEMGYVRIEVRAVYFVGSITRAADFVLARVRNLGKVMIDIRRAIADGMLPPWMIDGLAYAWINRHIRPADYISLTGRSPQSTTRDLAQAVCGEWLLPTGERRGRYYVLGPRLLAIPAEGEIISRPTDASK